MSTKEGDHGRATFLHAHRLHCRRARSSIRRIGSLVSKELGADDAAAAQLRQHRPVPLLQPGRLRPRLPRPAVRSADRRRQRPVPPASSGQQPTTTTALKRAGPRPARRTSTAAHADARLDLLQEMETRLRRRPSRRRAAEPPDRLRPGRPADAHGRGQGLQPGRGDRPICATPTAATCSARAACWPAGWSSTACRSSR